MKPSRLAAFGALVGLLLMASLWLTPPQQFEPEPLRVTVEDVPQPQTQPPKAAGIEIPLITGCGRSGSLSVWHLLQIKLGVRTLHERIHPSAVTVSWLYAVPSADTYPFEDAESRAYRLNSSFAPVLHVVRHPLQQIASTQRCFCGGGNLTAELGYTADATSWAFVDLQLGSKMPPGLALRSLRRSMVYWYEWNTHVSIWRPKVVGVVQVEQLRAADLGSVIDLSAVAADKLLSKPTSMGHKTSRKIAKPVVTWRHLADEDAVLARQIFDLAQQYGYEAGREWEQVV